MLDSNLRLLNAAVSDAGGGAISVVGAAVTIQRTGVHENSQFVVFVPTAPGTAGRVLTVDLELALDGGFAAADGTGAAPTANTIASLRFDVGFKGQRTVNIGRMIPWQQYTGSNIQVRAVARTAAVAGAANWGTVQAFLGAGEEEVYGRKAAAAETLVGDI